MRDARAQGRSEHVPVEGTEGANSARRAPDSFLPARASGCVNHYVCSVLVAHVAFATAAAQENARGAWRATNNDCFIQAFALGDRGMASVSYSTGASEQGARWTWRGEGLSIVSDRR